MGIASADRAIWFLVMERTFIKKMVEKKIWREPFIIHNRADRVTILIFNDAFYH